jgi:hypothetical protein
VFTAGVISVAFVLVIWVNRRYLFNQLERTEGSFGSPGISGAALKNRPGVLRLQEAALARRVDGAEWRAVGCIRSAAGGSASSRRESW